MGLPPRIYTLCQEMLKRLDTHFTLLPKRKIGKRSRHRKGESSAPEIITMSVVVTMCTLVYNLENEITWVYVFYLSDTNEKRQRSASCANSFR